MKLAREKTAQIIQPDLVRRRQYLGTKLGGGVGGRLQIHLQLDPNLLVRGHSPRQLRRSANVKQIKLEMDIQPPPHATTEFRAQILPTPYQVRLYDLGSLFAGKLHAVLCRGWKNRVKGRDFYDFVWYVGRKVAPNLRHLDARMRQSKHW